MNQTEFDEKIRRRITAFWAARGHMVGPGGVDCRWPCEIVELQRLRTALHKAVDTDSQQFVRGEDRASIG